MRDILESVLTLVTAKARLYILAGGVFFGLLLLIAALFGAIFGLKDMESNSAAATDGSVMCTSGEIHEKKIAKQLENAGAFSGKMQEFLSAAKKNKIDPVLLIAIAMHETGNGTSHAVSAYNNPGGLMGSGGLMHFDSLQEGLNFMANNLYKLYISQGLVTIEDIGNKYAPVGAANDPTNLNASWIPTVSKLVNNMGGLTMNCKQVSSGSFISPTGSMQINSPFGKRIDPITGAVTEFHKGVDFACTLGQPIHAASNGKVVVAIHEGWGGGYGHHVIEKSGDKFLLYGHMSTVLVNVSDTVKQGDVIGKCGSTGSSTGPHMHFEVETGQIYGQRHDPMPYFKGKKGDKE